MPYKKGYINAGRNIFTDGGFKPLPAVEVKGEISIKTIPKEFVERHSVKIGDITPFTHLRVTK